MKTVQVRLGEPIDYKYLSEHESSKKQRTKRSKSRDPRSQDQDLSLINR